MRLFAMPALGLAATAAAPMPSPTHSSPPPAWALSIEAQHHAWVRIAGVAPLA